MRDLPAPGEKNWGARLNRAILAAAEAGSEVNVTPSFGESSPFRWRPAGDYDGRYAVPGSGTDDREAIQGMLDGGAQPAGVYQFSEIRRRGVTVSIPAGVYLIGARSDGQPSLK